jgi:hypothetical protein
VAPADIRRLSAKQGTFKQGTFKQGDVLMTEPVRNTSPAEPAGLPARRAQGIYHDASAPELLCRYPNAPIVKVAAKDDHEVTVLLRGEPVRIRVPNARMAIVGRDYLYIEGGIDDGLYLVGEE